MTVVAVPIDVAMVAVAVLLAALVLLMARGCGTGAIGQLWSWS